MCACLRNTCNQWKQALTCAQTNVSHWRTREGGARDARHPTSIQFSIQVFRENGNDCKNLNFNLHYTLTRIRGGRTILAQRIWRQERQGSPANTPAKPSHSYQMRSYDLTPPLKTLQKLVNAYQICFSDRLVRNFFLSSHFLVANDDLSRFGGNASKLNTSI